MGINLEPTDLQSRMVSPIKNSFNKKKGWFGHPIPWEIDNDYRVSLAHARDDAVIHYHNYELNIEFLNSPQQNCLTYTFGDHAFGGQEMSLMGWLIYQLARRGY